MQFLAPRPIQVWFDISLPPSQFLTSEREIVYFPVPVRLTVCGLPAALSLMVIAPVRVPAAVGVNFTLIAQCLPTASVAPQVVVLEKSPLATMLVMLSVAVPEFVSVTDFAALVVLSARLGKVRLVGDKLTAGAED